MTEPEPTTRIHLRELLARRGMKSKDLAEKLGIDPAKVSKLANGKMQLIRFETIARICHYLGCEVGDLITVEYPRSQPEQGVEAKAAVE